MLAVAFPDGDRVLPEMALAMRVLRLVSPPGQRIARITRDGPDCAAVRHSDDLPIRFCARDRVSLRRRRRRLDAAWPGANAGVGAVRRAVKLSGAKGLRRKGLRFLLQLPLLRHL